MGERTLCSTALSDIEYLGLLQQPLTFVRGHIPKGFQWRELLFLCYCLPWGKHHSLGIAVQILAVFTDAAASPVSPVTNSL